MLLSPCHKCRALPNYHLGGDHVECCYKPIEFRPTTRSRWTTEPRPAAGRIPRPGAGFVVGENDVLSRRNYLLLNLNPPSAIRTLPGLNLRKSVRAVLTAQR